MGILSFFARRRKARAVAQAAAALAQRSHNAVLDRVRRRASTMRIAEARGYVRSRALDIAHRELKAMHAGQIPYEPDMQTQIIGRATEAVVASVLAELRSVPKAARAGERRAA